MANISDNQRGPVPPCGPYAAGSASGEAMVLAGRTQGVTDAELQQLASHWDVNYDNIVRDLRKGPRDTETKIGKNGCQWEYEKVGGAHYVRNLRWTPEEEMQRREKHGMVRGSQKLRESKV